GNFIGLIEPAIEDAEIQDAVQARLHTASTTSLLPAPGSVEPKVDSLDHLTANPQSVVLDENDVSGELGIVRQLHYLTNQHFSGMVLGMSFPCNQNLDRPICACQDAPQPLDVAEKKSGTLIGCKTAG